MESLDHLKIMIVEDDVITGRLMFQAVRSLVSEEQELPNLDSAEAAIAKVQETLDKKERPFDFIITDVYLSGDQTGIDLVQYCIRKQLPCQYLLVSSFNRSDFASELAEIEKTGNLYYMKKPFSIDGLLKSVLKIVEEQAKKKLNP
jgi:response regulator of citrate/malate metabolism